jgi:hypothetical protein
VRDAIAAIAADAVAAYDPDEQWPVAEVYDVASWTTALPLTNLFTGAAGVNWGLDAPCRRGLADVRLDLAAAARRAHELWQAAPDFAERSGPPARTQ